MFDEVTKREGGTRAAQRAGYLFGSTAFQIALVAVVIIVSARIKAAVTDEPVVNVKFVKPVAPPAPPPPPAPPAARKRPPTEKPPANLPPPPPPTALLQPKEVQEEMKANPNEPKEPEYDYGASSGEGVVGGVVGANAIEDAPQFATSGFVKPAEAERGCVGRSVRMPKDLQGLVSSVTVKFAVGRDGSVSLFQVMSSVPDPRISSAVWAAIQSCRFTPGTDPSGKPTKIWALQVIRFQAG